MRSIQKSLLAGMSAVAMTSTNTITSAPFRLEHLHGFSLQAVWTGTPAGNFKLQGSNDLGSYDGEVVSGVTNWTDIPSSTVAAGGAAGSTLWNIDGAHYRWMRLSYTNTSSTGTLTVATVNGKE